MEFFGGVEIEYGMEEDKGWAVGALCPAQSALLSRGGKMSLLVMYLGPCLVGQWHNVGRSDHLPTTDRLV